MTNKTSIKYNFDQMFRGFLDNKLSEKKQDERMDE